MSWDDDTDELAAYDPDDYKRPGYVDDLEDRAEDL